MTWCGYIDMLGTRAIVQRSRHDLLIGLHAFHSALQDNFDHLDGGRCFAFSDGAFFICPSEEKFFPFYKGVRNQLFQGAIYFRCSLIRGEIGVIKKSRSRKEKRPKDGLPDFFSLTFADDAPKAYQMESEFKGVGCFIEGSNKNKSTVPSFFLKVSSNSVKSYPYRDFRYSEFELSRPSDSLVKPSYDGELRLFDKLISACHATLTQSSSVASYYVSALVAMIRSTDLTKSDYRSNEGWLDTPYVFEEFMGDGMNRVLKGLPGLNLIYLACFDHLFHEHKAGIPVGAESAILRRLLKVPGCFRNLDRIPEAVISPKARHRLIEIKVADAREGHDRLKSLSRQPE